MKEICALVWWKYSTKLIILCLIISYSNNSKSQTILNGNFETCSAPLGTSLVYLSNSQFNNYLSNCYCFSNSVQYYFVDIMTTDTYNQTPYPQSGIWYIGIESKGFFSMELSDSLEIGQIYKLSFYAQGFIKSCSIPIEIGVSTVNNSFGSSVFVSSSISDKKWNLILVTFTASVKAKYITVKAHNCTDGVTNGWAGVDNFCLQQEKYCIDLPEIEMSNVFTPNKDGINDYFKPAVFKGMKSGEMKIMNRWGQVIFETNDMQTGWDGTYNGKPVSDGTYFYKISYETIFEEEKTEHGYLSLLR